jgi:ADP-ribose 1''-phosphate phosphatase
MPRNLRLSNHIGDIFAAPPNTLLIHACNTQGSWGAGIAAAFRDRYPEAYKVYRAHCLTTNVRTGTALFIPPCETNPKFDQHWIGCLFTSARFGRAKDSPAQILAATVPAMKELFNAVKREEEDGNEVSGVRTCKINSARFGVPWPRTVKLLEGIVVEDGWKGDVEVWSID